MAVSDGMGSGSARFHKGGEDTETAFVNQATNTTTVTQ